MIQLSQKMELEDLPHILWQSGSGVSLKAFSGEGARPYLNQIAALRMDLYKAFPYLYDGSLENEKKYLDTFFNSKNSKILLVFDHDKVVGFSNSLPLIEESDWLVKPFERASLNPGEYLYMSDFILKAPYRGKGLLRRFFEAHEKNAKINDCSKLALMTVKREPSHPQSPEGYQPLDDIWRHFRMDVVPDCEIVFLWNQVDTKKEETNRLQVWSKVL
jgi:hypothetical protein